MAFLDHNPVSVKFDRKQLITFDVNKKKKKGQHALGHSMFIESDIIFLQQLPDRDTYTTLTTNHNFWGTKEKKSSDLLVKNTIFHLPMDIIVEDPELTHHICTKKLSLIESKQTLIAISWHGWKDENVTTMKQRFGKLLQFARQTCNDNEAQYVIIGGNFNIQVGDVREWLQLPAFENGFRVEAPEILTGIRKGKLNTDYFVYLSKSEIVCEPSQSKDINKLLGIKLPKQHEESACDLRLLFQLLSVEITIELLPNKPDEKVCKKPHLPEFLTPTIQDTKHKEVSIDVTTDEPCRCQKPHLLEFMSNADESIVIDCINILEGKH